MHTESHPQVGKSVRLNARAQDPIQNEVVKDAEYRIEDWWDKLTGQSWMFSDGNPAAMHYGIRSGMAHLPVDDDVVYGKIGSLGHLVHVSELGEEL